jgi:hypothetical protein
MSATSATSASEQSGAASTATSTKMASNIQVFKLVVPIMGNIMQVSSKEVVAYTGGKPKHDWTGLENPHPCETNGQSRPTS